MEQQRRSVPLLFTHKRSVLFLMDDNNMMPQNEPELPSDVLKEAKRAYSGAQLNIALYLLISLLLSAGVSLVLIASGTEELPMGVNYALSFGIMYCIAFPIYLLLSKRLPTTKPEEHHMPIGQLLLAFLCCECIAIGGNLIGTFFNLILTLILGVDTASTMLADGVFGDSTLIFTSIAVLLAPIIEELMFRKVLIDRIRKYGDGAAILISGIMFGLFHGNFSQFFYAAGLGMLFAFIYVRTGRIRYTIALHTMVNFWGSVMPLLMLRNIDTDAMFAAIESNDFSALTAMIGDMIPFLGFVVCNYMLALAGLILLIVFRKKIRIPSPIVPLPKGKRFGTACLNLGCALLVAGCIFEFVSQIMQNTV